MSPKTLFLDIETFPHTVSVWRLYEDNALETLHPSIICGFSAKWLGGKQITKALPDYDYYTPGSRDDALIVSDIHQLLEEADIVVAHNGAKFDLPVINARIAVAGLPPPAPYKVVDTCREARRVFKFGANSLDYLCQIFGLGRKLATGGYELWQLCMAGDLAAWGRMKRYNAHDVKLLEKLYLRIMPWCGLPNKNVYTTKAVCPRCGAGKLQSRGEARSLTRIYQRYQCKSCGSWSRSVKATSTAKVVAA